MWLYAILRAVPNKLGGVVALFAGILFLGVLPFLMVRTGELCGMGHSSFSQFFFWALVRDFLVLTWLGRCPAEDPFNFFAQVSSVLYFLLYLGFSI